MAETDNGGWSAWPAPAKLNLFLHVLGRRSDGYHELQTLFQLLDWGDEIRIRVTSDGSIRRLEASYPVPAEEDLVVRAARLLQTAAPAGAGAEIDVRKAIPLGSGLGGGSSDAATVLLALNRAWGCALSAGELAVLAARLGADVPVFVHGRTALASGIGEQLTPVSLGRRDYVLVLPDLPISTAAVFGDPMLRRDSRPISLAEARTGLGRNDCEAVVLARFPEMAALFDSLSRWGHPRLTGTGSAVFLEMADAEASERTAQEMKNLYNVRAVGGVDCSPLHARLDADGTKFTM